MEKNKVKRSIVTILIVAFVIIVLWLIVIYPLIRFNVNENTVESAAKRYYEINSNKLPSEGDITTLSVTTLLDQKYITDLRTAYNKDTCSARESWVKVKKESGNYKYYVYLKCGVFSSNVDHKGPVIELNGDKSINVEKGEKFTDPGIKSVTDNTDGEIDVKEVYTKSDVNTNSVGTYTVTYSVVDSFQNKTEVTRNVVVSQSLTTTVKNQTDSSNYYTGTSPNNYINFSGQLFRIVGLDSEGNIKIVSDEDIASVDYKSVNDWLNDYYYKHLAENSKKYIVNDYEWCSDTVNSSNINKVSKCNGDKIKQNIGLLSIFEYNRSLKEGESYLYTNTINLTASSMSSDKVWTTRDNFTGTDSKYLEFSKNYNFKVRPVIVLKKDIKVKSGDGTHDTPYKIGDVKKAKAGTKTTERYSGEYITYGGMVYRIVEGNANGNTKVVSTEAIDEEQIEFGTGSTYNPEKTGNVGYFIENNISKYAKVGIFVKKEISVPVYENKASYNAKKTYNKYKVKFSAPSMYEMYSAYMDSYWFIESSKTANVRYASSYNGTVYFNMNDLIGLQANIIYTGYLKKTASIISGDGTIYDPYKLDY